MDPSGVLGEVPGSPQQKLLINNDMTVNINFNPIHNLAIQTTTKKYLGSAAHINFGFSFIK